MALTVRDLINQQAFPNLKLLAGHQGVKNEIRWVNLMEILDSPETVSPNELLFTTGYGLQDGARYEDLIPRLAECGVSGLVIQPGYYIDLVPAYMLEQAEQYHFPILSIPKSVTFSSILHTMVQLIDLDQQRSWNSGPKQRITAFLDRLLKLHSEALFPPEGEANAHSVYLLLLEPVNHSYSNLGAWRDCLAQIRSFIQSHSIFYRTEELSQFKHVFLISNTSPGHPPMFHELNTKFALLSEQYGTNWYMGADQLYSPEDCATALDHSIEALDTLCFIQAKRGVCTYHDIDFLKALGYMHQSSHSSVLNNRVLQLLLNYDRTNNTGYVETLRVYLANSCNVTQTAKRLFIHRHTLLKRLNKIREIGDVNLDDHYARLYLSINLLFHDYFIY